MFGFNSKKRPNSLIIGRTYDNQILDMFELGVESMKTMDDFKVSLPQRKLLVTQTKGSYLDVDLNVFFKVPKITLGIKPCLTFSGEAFEIDPEYIRLKCMLAGMILLSTCLSFAHRWSSFFYFQNDQDFFKGEIVENIRLQGLEHVYNFTAVDGKVYLRSYRYVLKKPDRVPYDEWRTLTTSVC